MKLKKKKTFVITVIFLLIVGGLFWYDQDLKFRIADMKLCGKGLFHYQTKKLEDGCYDAKSYGKYHFVVLSKIANIYEINNEVKAFFLQNDTNHLKDVSYNLNSETIKVNSSMKRFAYYLSDQYVVVGFLDRKVCLSILCREVGDVAYFMIFKKDTQELINGGKLVVARSNPANYGKGDFQEGRPYKPVSKNDIQNIIRLGFENDLK